MSGIGDLLQQLIGGARAAQRDPRLPAMPVPLVGLDLAAPFNALPAPLRQVASTMPMGALLTNPIADMAANAGRAGLNATSRATTGQMLANLGRLLENPVAHAALGTPTGRAVASTLPVAGGLARALMIPGLMEAAEQARANQATTAGGNPWQRALAANEAGARGNEGTVGLVNAVYDPTNALPLAGELAKVNQLGRLAKVLEGVNTMQGVANVPLMGAGETTSAALRRLRNRVNMLQTGREAAQGLGPAFDVAQAEAGVRQLARGRQFVDEGGLGGPEQIGHLPTLPDAAFNTSVGGRYGNGPGRPGPALPPELGPGLPPEYGPALPTRGNVPPSWGPIGPALPPEGAPLDIPQGPPRRRGVPVPETQLPIGPNLPPVVGPSRPGRRGIPETVLPTPVAPTAYGRETFSLGNPLQLQETAQRLGIRQPAPQTVEDLRAAFAGLRTPAPAVPPVTAAVSAPTPPSTVADLGGNVSREAVIQATANRPPNALTPTLRSLHNAVYPGGQADFAIPRLTGVNARDFRTSLLTDHPTGNVAEQYLDYLVSRVQGDKRAAARLAQADPDLLADVMALPPHPTPVNEQKVALQQRLGAGKFRAGVTPEVAAATDQIAGATAPEVQSAFDAILASGDSGKMSGELPAGTAFWERRLGVGPDEARALLAGAVADGRLGVGPDGALRFKPPALSNVDIAPEGAPRPSTVEPLPPPPDQPSAGELLRRYRERWPEGTPVDTPASAVPEVGPEKSVGHVAFVGNSEYFTGPGGNLYRAPIGNGMEVAGYRSGARFESTPTNAQRAIQIAQAAEANAIPVDAVGQAGLPGLGTKAAPPVTPTQARDELFADAADTGVADVAQAAPTGPLFDSTAAMREAERFGSRKWDKYAELRDAAAQSGATFAPGDEPVYQKPLAQWLREEDAQTPAQVRSLTNEHRQFIIDATVQGKAVPPSILADFPGIERDIATARLQQQYTELSRQAMNAEQELRFGKKGTPPTGKKAAALQAQVTDLRAQYEAIGRQIQQAEAAGGDIAAGGGGGGGLGIAAPVVSRQTGAQILHDLAERTGVRADAFRTDAILHPEMLTPELFRDTFNIPEADARTLVDYLTGADIKQGALPTVSGEGLPPALRAFTEGSRAANPDGTPMVLYHGGGGDFATFRPTNEGMFGTGIYFADDPAVASDYAMKPRNAAAPNVKPVYVSLKNPAIVDFPPPHNTTPPDLAGVPLEHFAEEAQRLGYDGVIGHSDDVGREYVVFDPRQVKSATGNRGTYDPNDPSLLRAANLPGGLAGAWRGGATLLGAGTGATAGGVAGFATGDGDFEDRLKRGWQASLAGAALGGAAGLGLSRNTTGEAADNILRHAWDQAGKGQAEAVAARQTSGVIPKLGDIWPALKRARIQHPKNLLQDEGFGSVVTAGLQPRAWENLAQNREDVSRRLATAKTDEDLLPTPTQDRRAAMGLQGTPVNLGASLAQGEKKAGRQLSDIQTGIIEGGASLLSPTGLATNAIGVGLGAAKGLGRGALSGLFHGINDVTNGTFRSSIYDDELATLAEGAATDFLGALRAKGIDVSSLAPDGSFSAADAERVAGPAAGKAWAGWVNHANDLAQQRARFIMGDYGKVGPIEKMLGGPVPFASWVIRAYPVALALAAEHPIVALAMYQYYRATQKTKGDGSPDYTGGMIPIPTSTPYVGPLVSAMVPGNKGTVYVDPVGAISPVSNEMFSAGEDDPGATWYQKATKFLERTGLPGVNPAIQTGAYLTGLDYKGPGSQTNTQGLEDAAALIPGNAGLPNPMPGLLAAGRSAISPAIGPAIGGQADPNASVYDPVTKRYAELWYEKTHLTLSDPRNRIGLVGMADPDNPLMQQARREVLLAGAARNVNSLVDPVGATAQTDTAKDVKAAQDQAALPSYGALAGLDPFIRAQVQQQIDAAKAANPLLTLHQGETPAARANMLILDWERQNQGLRNLWPGMYQLQLLAERERLGLERPGSVAQEYRTFDQRNAGTLPGGPMIMPGVPLPMDNRAGQAVRDLVRQRLSAGR